MMDVAFQKELAMVLDNPREKLIASLGDFH
jgi:hypothetical protein